MVHKIENPPRINLMILISSYGLGGYEKALKELIENLNKDIFKLSVVLLYPFNKAKKLHPDIRKKYFRFLYWENIERDTIIMRSSFDLLRISRIIKLMKKHDIDGILYFALGIGSFIVPIAATVAGLKFIIRRAGTSYKGIYPKVFKCIDKYLISKTDLVILTNDFLKKEFSHELHVPNDKIVVIPTGIDIKKLKNSRSKKIIKRELYLEPDCKVIGIIANLTPVKYHEVLLKAANLVFKEFPNTYVLLVGDGPRKSHLEKLCRELGIRERIKFLGHCDTVENIIPVFDVGVLSSKKEVHPLSIIEIMASGIPVVAPSIGGIPNIVEHGRSGIIYSPGDHNGLADGIKKLLRDRDLREKYGRYAKTFVYKNLTKNQMIKRYQETIINLYEKKVHT